MSGALRRALVIIPIVLLVLGLGAVALVVASRPQPELLQGEVEARQVNVAAKIPARVAAVLIREGQRVTAGQALVTLASPEVTARREQATAARDAAVAQRDKAVAGAREEEVRGAAAQLQRATHARELAEKTFNRVDRLNHDGVLPTQRRDEAEAALATARDAEDGARALWEMARNGARVEDKAGAQAMVARADGAVAEVDAFLAETSLASPIAGEVLRSNAEPGELLAAGMPAVTLVDLDDVWVTFNLREDRLPGIAMGSLLTGRLPALGGREITLKVDYIAPQGDFATWRATATQGGFDLKTFEVRARPERAVPGLRPGMSVLVSRAGKG
jgi:HlyD family secretion protein